jgi:hypothetical protein
MSSSLLRSCRHPGWHPGVSTRRRARVLTAEISPAAPPSPAMTRDEVHTVLFREPCDVRPERPKSSTRRRERVLFGVPRRRFAQAIPKHPCPLHGSSSVSGREPHPSPSSVSSLATTARERDACTVLRCRSSALSRGMSCRPQQPTIFIFQRRTPVSRIAIRSLRTGESLHSRRGSRFGALSPVWFRRLFAGGAFGERLL